MIGPTDWEVAFLASSLPKNPAGRFEAAWVHTNGGEHIATIYLPTGHGPVGYYLDATDTSVFGWPVLLNGDGSAVWVGGEPTTFEGPTVMSWLGTAGFP
jgi:hypothetical protein